MITDCAPATSSVAGLSREQTSQVIRVLESYLGKLERGCAPRPEELVAQYPELGEVLKAYLEKLALLNHAAAGMRGLTPAEEPPPALVSAKREQLGDFRIIREVGRGGMGIVYEAEQLSLGRRVALKVLPLAPTLDAKQLRRFKREAQAAAHLHHTHIVPVYAVGADEGVHYYAMQFIEGRTLAALVAERRQKAASVRRRVEKPAFFRLVAQLGAQAAAALEYAHQMGVVHRDIKPANLLVDARQHVWITDFGLALYQSEGGLTLTGDVLGTLRYMSPEQALARPSRVDQRTDVYSLGATLYELLTLEPVYGGRDRQEVLRQLAFEEPRPPRQVNPAIPVELETIVLKALARELKDRYATAQELADDLRRFLEHKPVLARRPTLVERATKWARRHRPVVAMAGLLVVLALAGLATSTVLIWREQAKTKDALAKAVAEENAAKLARTRAEINFMKACQGVLQPLYPLREKRWENLRGVEALGREQMDRSVAFLKEFLQAKSSEPAARLEAARIYHVLATVYWLRGDLGQATAACRKSVAGYEKLVVESYEVAGCHAGLATVHEWWGQVLHGQGKTEAAAAEFAQVVSHSRQALKDRPYFWTLNQLAWFLVTCPQERFRDAAEAVTLAKQAVQQTDGWCPDCLNTLGVAQYRAGNWSAAVEALHQAMKRRGGGGDGDDWFFLAMAYWRLGDKDHAQQYYGKAMTAPPCGDLGMDSTAAHRREAEALLGPWKGPAKQGQPGSVSQ